MNRSGMILVIGLVAPLVAFAQSGGSYDLTWNSLDGGGGVSTGGTFQLRGTIGQPDAGDLVGGSFSVAGGFWAAVATAAPCSAAVDCADLDANATRDDNCVWWECVATACADTPLGQFADMGGAFGACPPDQFANIHDRNHALACFSGANACETVNIDAGGAFGACPPEGFCNIHDANHALSAFAGTSTCSCPSGPAPELAPLIAGDASMRVTADRRDVAPGDQVVVRVFVESAKTALRSYQLDIEVSGGNTGRLELVEVQIEPRKDWVFANRVGVFDAFNASTGQMLAGLDGDEGVSVLDGGYLATYTYSTSKDASGSFVVDVQHGSGGQTFLVAPQDGMIEIGMVQPATISVPEPATRR